MVLPFISRSYTTPRFYADVNLLASRSYWDYENLQVKWSDLNDFKCLEKLGSGKFSNVYKGLNLNDGKNYVLKALKSETVNMLSKCKREILVLQNLKGGPNIPTLHKQEYDEDAKSATLVLDYNKGTDLRVASSKLSDFDLRYYTYELLKTLDFAHSHGIIHRDVKPNNIIIDHSSRVISLIDWGLADFYKPNTKLKLRVATMYYKPPEILLENGLYDYTFDSWCLGVTLAGVLFQNDPFFKGLDYEDQLLKILELTGTNELFRYLSRHKLLLPPKLKGRIVYETKKANRMYFSKTVHHLAKPDALDLLDKLLTFDHTDRPLAAEVLDHPYFDPVKEVIEKVSVGSLNVPKEYRETAEILLNLVKSDF